MNAPTRRHHEAIESPLGATPAPRFEGVRMPALADVVSAYPVAAPAELERAALTRRFDRKFLLRAEHARAVAESLAGHYRVVLARDERFALYDTVYFDTADLRLYHDHRRARRPRAKVRIRNYLDRELSMLEFKEKTPRGDTRKARWARPDMSLALTADDLARLATVAPALVDAGLEPAARTAFYRLMLVNAVTVERATLDFHLTLSRGGAERVVDELVVVEVKDGGRGAVSPLVSALHHHHARALPFSKYCMAVALNSRERANSFLPSLRALAGVP